MQLVFIHGWGMNSRIWQSTIEALQSYECKTIDLGFVKGGETHVLNRTRPTIVITHSLGTTWFLKNYKTETLGELNLKALVAVSGFTNFSSFTPEETLKKMKEGVLANSAAQMALFWRRAGCKNFASPENLNPEKLHEGLEWLANWDAAVEAKALKCPKFILASKADKIVPASAIEGQWLGEKIIWHHQAPHCLQLAEPEWVAENILKQAQAL
jgi:pimeloyl-ACP methyl ester carboxylesterase